MNMRIASAKDAAILTSLMHAAFQAAVPPSSALSETVEDVATQLAEGREQAAICWEDDHPAGMVRFLVES
ncbi:hypothetical protein P4479_01585 [Brevibacillus agri]|uniref:hypothetical protein n=1 Tax=Brevibacillus agri TaxID=51101 RepID=UPI002E22329E|nr:hypothetical protein [Brevibacillus agri]